MTDAISANAATAPVAGANTSRPAASGKAATEKFSTEAPASTEPPPINPRLRFDAAAGVVVTEFLSSGGEVQTQSPSNAVLAYLRVGLGSDGFSRRAEDGSTKG
jgi:hypothetical protein